MLASSKPPLQLRAAAVSDSKSIRSRVEWDSPRTMLCRDSGTGPAGGARKREDKQTNTQHKQTPEEAIDAMRACDAAFLQPTPCAHPGADEAAVQRRLAAGVRRCAIRAPPSAQSTPTSRGACRGAGLGVRKAVACRVVWCRDVGPSRLGARPKRSR